MSKNQGNKREIIRLDEVPRSRTPEPAPKRSRSSRSTSKGPLPGSNRSDESRARATRGVIASAAEVSALWRMVCYQLLNNSREMSSWRSMGVQYLSQGHLLLNSPWERVCYQLLNYPQGARGDRWTSKTRPTDTGR